MHYLTDPLERADSMTKIEHFAALAMAKIIGSDQYSQAPSEVAKHSVSFAIALIDRLNADFRSGFGGPPNASQSGTFADWCEEEKKSQASAAKDDL